jgi:hypothetical protein
MAEDRSGIPHNLRKVYWRLQWQRSPARPAHSDSVPATGPHLRQDASRGVGKGVSRLRPGGKRVLAPNEVTTVGDHPIALRCVPVCYRFAPRHLPHPKAIRMNTGPVACGSSPLRIIHLRIADLVSG